MHARLWITSFPLAIKADASAAVYLCPKISSSPPILGTYSPRAESYW